MSLNNLAFRSPPTLSQGRATVEVIAAAGIWGFGFVSTVWALETFGPLWMTSLRFLFAFLVIGAVLWKSEISPGLRDESLKLQMKKEIRLTFWPGVFIGSSLLLQTWALLYTTPTKSAFITVLYILFVPVLERIFMKRHLSLLHFVCIFVGLGGMALMTRLELGALNPGDLLTLGCAIMAALHIFWISKVSSQIQSSLRFNLFQSFWAGVLPLFGAIFCEPIGDKPLTSNALIGFLTLSLGSTALAFFLQIRAQRVLSATVASMLFLLESPFGGLFSFYFLGEVLSENQWFGALLIMGSAAGALVVDRRTKRQTSE